MIKQSAMAALDAAIKGGNIALANDQQMFYPQFNGDVAVPHGSVLAANDANFDAQYLSEPLQDYIVGAPEDDGVQAVLDAIFPAVPVGRAFTYRTHDTREQFQDDADSDADIREIGGDFAQVRRTGAQADGRTDNKGLVMVLDNDQGGEDARVQQRAVLNLRSRLFRSDLRRGLALVENAASNTGANFNAVDPDVAVLEAIDRGGDARGVDSNIVVFGRSAKIKRIKGLRTKNTPDQVGASFSDAQLAGFYGVDQVVTVASRRQSTASAKAKILGDIVYAFYGARGAMPDDPSNVKRFVTNTASGALRVYVMPKLKKTVIAVEHYSRLVLTSALGIEKLTVTFS